MPSLTELTLAGFAGWLVLDPSALPLLHERYQDVLTALAPHVAVILSYDRTTLIAVAVTGAIIAVLFILFYQKAVSTVKVDLSIGPMPTRRVTTTELRLPDKPNMIQCYSPATLQYLGEVPVTTPEEVHTVVARGRAVQAIWSKTSWAERRRVLEMFKRTILAQEDDIVRISCIDTGKTRVDAQFGEILSSLGKLDWVIAEGEKVLAPESRPTNLTSIHKQAHVHYAPLGVIGVIAPWNYPFYNLFNHIASGLFAGNAVVLKISEYSAWSGSKYINVAREVLKAAGHSPDLVQLVQGFGETGAALVAATDKVIFTGSPGVGKLVMKGASSTLTPLVLELGGKDPVIVCDDAPVEGILPITLRGTYQNAGQNCVGVERVYVYESVYDQFVEGAVKVVKRMRVGPTFDPVTGAFTDADMGTITTAPQLGLIQALVDDAVAKGAKLHCGGQILYAGAGAGAGKAAGGAEKEKEKGKRGRSASPAPSRAASGDAVTKGLFYPPTVLSGVNHTMRIANEEVFGPVLAIFKVAGNSDDTAVAMANSTEYGLGASVFSSNPRRANAIAERIRSGMVGVNAYGLNYLVQSLPFGGVKASGFDRFSGPEGLRACCLTKSVVTDLLPFLSIPTPVPAPLQYPLPGYAHTFVRGLLGMQFAPSWAGRIAAIWKLATAGMGDAASTTASKAQ